MKLCVSDEVLSITFENIPYWSDTESKAKVCGTAATDRESMNKSNGGGKNDGKSRTRTHTHAQVKALVQYTHIWG